jgi:hypothetical protein
MSGAARNQWLDRRIAAPGPYLTLCLTEAQFAAACKHIKVAPPQFVKNEWSDATAHYFESPRGLTVVVCLRGWQGRDPIEIAGLLVHEAVHVWQEYAERIGETHPGHEQEAYAIQAIAQELMAEFARLAA